MRWKLTVLLVAAALMFTACGGEAPPPLKCPGDQVYRDGRCQDEKPDPEPENPEPDPEPVPEPDPIGGDPTRMPKDYLTKARVGNPSQGLLKELRDELQTNASQGWRDVEHVLSRCSDAAADGANPVFSMKLAELSKFATDGLDLDGRGRIFDGRMWNAAIEEFIPNKRCAVDHREHDPAFCGRADIRTTVMKTYRDELRAHLADAQRLRDDLVGQPGHGENYDSIKGWCDFRNQGGNQ